MLANWTQSPVFLALVLIFAIGGCTSNAPPASSGSAGTTLNESSAASAESAAGFVSSQVQSINTPLNTNPAYAITAADLNTLGSEGILNTEDQALLNQLVQN